jgi:hypothetical protein
LVITEKIQSQSPTREDKLFVLYLPMDEVHELGLMYLNYEILSSGYKSIYLGQSVPIDSLRDLKKYFNNIVYVCYSTVEPIKNKINPYILELKEQILVEDSQLWVIGRNVQNIDTTILSKSVRKFDTITELISEL